MYVKLQIKPLGKGAVPGKQSAPKKGLWGAVLETLPCGVCPRTWVFPGVRRSDQGGCGSRVSEQRAGGGGIGCAVWRLRGEHALPGTLWGSSATRSPRTAAGGSEGPVHRHVWVLRCVGAARQAPVHTEPVSRWWLGVVTSSRPAEHPRGCWPAGS